MWGGKERLLNERDHNGDGREQAEWESGVVDVSNFNMRDGIQKKEQSRARKESAKWSRPGGRQLGSAECQLTRFLLVA